MSRSHSYAMALTIVSACVASAIAADIGSDDPVEIPLKKIWALNIPGTRNVRDLDPPRQREPQSEEEFIRTSLVEQIVHSLSRNHWPKEGEKAGQAFVVVGTGVDALRQATRVLAGEAKRKEAVPADKELTLVFYTYNSGRSLRLDEVHRRGNEVAVDYHLEAYEGMLQSFTYFALIPLGKLAPGEVQVTVTRATDTGPSYLVERFKSVPAERLVSGSFTFEVTR